MISRRNGSYPTKKVVWLSRPRSHFFFLIGLLGLAIDVSALPNTGFAEQQREFPDPSSISLNQTIKVVTMPNTQDLFYEVKGTVSHAVKNADADDVLISSKPVVSLQALTQDGTIISQSRTQTFAEATSSLRLPLQDGEELDYVILQYPFKAYLKATHDTETICVSDGKLKDCEQAPPIDRAQPLEFTLPESALEITSYKIITEEAGVSEELVAVNGVVELFLQGEDAKLRPELSISVHAGDRFGKILETRKLRAHLSQLRHVNLPNPNPTEGGLPFLAYAVGLYHFAGHLPLSEEMTSIHAFLEESAFQARPAERSLAWLDSDRDGSLTDEDYDGDGIVDHKDLFTS